MSESSSSPTSFRPTGPAIALIGLGILLGGLAFNPSPVATHDERRYEYYCQAMVTNGFRAYPEETRAYLAEMAERPVVALPPTRFLYVAAGALLHGVTGLTEHRALAWVSLLAADLALLWSVFLAFRIFPRREACAIGLLMACAPLRLFLGSKAMIDGVFALEASVAIGSFWLILQYGASRRWLAAYALSLIAMVLTKENAAFVVFALGVILLIGRRLGLPPTPPGLWRATIWAPVVAVAMLAWAAGGWGSLVEVYTTLVVKARQNPFAIQTGNGPWFRYLLDLFILSPLLLLLATAGILHLRREQRPQVFFALFLAATFAVMASIQSGANLRYAAIWDLPLRVLAVTAAAELAARWTRRISVGFWILIAILALHDLHQYWTLFVSHRVYEPVPVFLLRALKVMP